MDIAGKKPMRPDAMFWIASQSKPLTCTALMVLVDDGKVNVDDPVDKYLPEFKGQMVVAERDEYRLLLKKPTRPMLVRDLMSHVSGLPGITPMMAPTLDGLPLAKTVLANTMVPLESEPGTKYKYSNPGMNTVGRIVEVVSGMPYERFMDERIFKPLGMKDTTFWPNTEQLARLAKSYKPTADKADLEETTISSLRYPLDDHTRYAFPGGGLFSTAIDLSRFYRMIANDGVFEGQRILSERSVAQMTVDQTGEAKSAYGFGFGTNGRFVTHGGAYGTNSRYDRDHQLITIFLVQHAGWTRDGKKILPDFQTAATAAFSKAPDKSASNGKAAGDSQLVVGIPGQTTTKPTVVATPTAQAAKSANEPVKIDGLTIVDRIRFFPAPDREQAMVGGRFTGSNVSPNTGFVPLAEIKVAPAKDQWSEISLQNQKPYRWVRYEAPAGSSGNLAELEFYSGKQKLKGVGFGSAGQLAPGGHWKSVFDDKPQTWFNSNNADGQYVGLDLGEQASTARPVITPGGGDWDKPQLVTMKSSTPGATIRYTLDGTAPGPNNGQLYNQPFMIDANTTLVAAAYKEGLAPSPTTIATIWIGKPTRPRLNSFHVGNSLTGNASRFSQFVRTAGGADNFPAYLIGGSLTVRLWNDSHGADQARWAENYAKAVHPLDYFTMQPRDFNVAQEADYATRFIKLVREKSPEVQPWLYAEWVEMARARPTDRGEVPSSQMKKTFPALTWEESMAAMLLYNEEVQQQIVSNNPGGKRVRILPTALAFGWARNLIDQGKFPGVVPGQAGFYETLFSDQVHVNEAGCFLVAATWYAALYRESPEGRLLPIGTNLTPEQARILQRLAWDVVKNYPDAGLYEEGSQACEAPMFVATEKTIELRSSTPGAWFRYTLDGTEPTRTRGYVYCGVISVQPGTKLKAVAFKSGLADSPVASYGGGAAN
jgi:CubicO group peptidase (beta-lactamase class C family)